MMIYGSVQNLTFWSPGVPSSSELISSDDGDTAGVWNIELGVRGLAQQEITPSC